MALLRGGDTSDVQVGRQRNGTAERELHHAKDKKTEDVVLKYGDPHL